MFTIDSKNVMTLTKGDSATFQITVLQADGTPYVLAPEDVITFTVKKGIETKVPVLLKTTGSTSSGAITLQPADTKKLTPTPQLPNGLSYVYDVQIKLANSAINTMVSHAPFVLDWEVGENG